MTGKRLLDLDDHHERIRDIWPVCDRCRVRYRRDLGHDCPEVRE